MQSTSKKLFFTFVLISIGALLIGGSSVAWFTSTAENTQNTFQSGTLKIELDREQGNYYFDLTNIAPGDQGTQTLVISNTGSLTLFYQISYTMRGDLAGGKHPLEIQFLNDKEEIIDLDLQRELARGHEETLMIAWEMPQEAGNEYQAGTAQFDLLVNASQVNHGSAGSTMQAFTQAMSGSAVKYDDFLSKSKQHHVGSPPYAEYYVDSWNGYLEKLLEAGDTESNLRIPETAPGYGNNTLGYQNPFSENEHKGLVVNLHNFGVINYLRHRHPYNRMLPTAIILTNESVFDHGRTNDSLIRNNLDVLKGTVVFYKPDHSANDQVQVYSINADGSKSALVPISEILPE